MSISSRVKILAKEWLPPIVQRALQPRRIDPEQAAEEFYRALVPADGLCFDVGANVGHRLGVFRRLGARVVAVEPQPKCFAMLRSRFGSDRRVTLLNQGLGSAPGQTTMTLSNSHVLSTMSQSFIDATTRSGRFGGASWNKKITVDLTTLDALIAEHGVPDFTKIDVEGYELEVVRGLSRPLPMVSMEWVPELTDNMLACVSHLAGLGPIRCNLSWGESMRMSRRDWVDVDTLRYILDQFREDTYLFGDVYIRADAAAR